MTWTRVLSIAALAGRTGKDVSVGVVDSGVHAGHPHVGGVSGGVAIGADGAMSEDIIDRLGHGTAVAAAIREKAPGAALWVVKVFDRSLTASGRALVTGMEMCARQPVQLINLSLGTANHDHRAMLSAAVALATECGVIVVSAAPQDGAAWLPGGLPGVVAVELDWQCPRDECRVAIGSDGSVRLSASGYPRPIPGVTPERNLSGPSFAVANATGLLALLLEGQPVQTTAALADRLRA